MILRQPYAEAHLLRPRQHCFSSDNSWWQVFLQLWGKDGLFFREPQGQSLPVWIALIISKGN